MSELRGRHAIVTGGGRGIGAAIATELARLGARLTLLGRDSGALDRHAKVLRAEERTDVAAFSCDVADEDSVAEAFRQAHAVHGDAYVLVNNAGQAESATFTETTRALWQRMLDINLTGAFLCTQHALPAMIAARAGRIVNIASTAGVRGYARMAAYCVSKHGLVGLTRALAQETAKHGVTVNAVCPGYTDTNMARQAVDNLVAARGVTPDEALKMLTRLNPRGMLTRPEEVAGAVAWLCSPAAAAVTGEAIVVAGGEVTWRLTGEAALPIEIDATDIRPRSFRWQLDSASRVATITLDRPERKNPLTFEMYDELRDTFRRLRFVPGVRAVVLAGAGDNFCSGGDVHEIIGPLVRSKESGRMDEILAFTRMTGDLVKTMRACPQPIIAAIDGVCAGAGAILAMASDLRYGTARSKVAFLFVRVGLSGADMGACAMLPRIIGQGRAADLLYTGRFMPGEEAERWGFYTRLLSPDALHGEAAAMARTLAAGPSFAHGMTKMALHQEWSMGIDEAIEAEAQTQAICMQTEDFARAYRAFVKKETPVFEGN